MRWLRRATATGLLLVVATGVAAAHQVAGSRFEAPIPLPLLYAGAGLTVAATAGWLAASSGTWGVSAGRRRLVRIPGRFGVAAERVARGAFLLAFLAAVASGIVGPAAAAENLATVFVWSVWLKGVAVVAAVLGSPWRVLSPWRTLYVGLKRLEGAEITVLGRYPPWLAEWPALFGFLVWVGIGENLTALPRSPRGTTFLLAVYALVMVLGAVAYGEEWLERADALAVLYRLFGRVAPVEVERGSTGDYVVRLRAPWAGCTWPVRSPPAAAFVVATVYTVSFDGFSNTPTYQNALLGAGDAVGAGRGIGLYLGGLGLFLASFAAVAALAEGAGNRRDFRAAVLALAPAVLPIAVAYEIAHNYPAVATNLGQLWVVLGTAVGATPAPAEPLAWLPLSAYWASQVLLVVGGHVVAVVAAHAVTVGRYPTRRRSARAHLPLTAVMVGYTVLSLWIISRPVVA